VKRVVKVVLDERRAGEAFDVEEGAVEKFELISWVVCPLRETWLMYKSVTNILTG
jgi:hypothetical protein